jgi:hypothetical protein
VNRLVKTLARGAPAYGCAATGSGVVAVGSNTATVALAAGVEVGSEAVVVGMVVDVSWAPVGVGTVAAVSAAVAEGAGVFVTCTDALVHEAAVKRRTTIQVKEALFIHAFIVGFSRQIRSERILGAKIIRASSACCKCPRSQVPGTWLLASPPGMLPHPNGPACAGWPTVTRFG